MAITKNKKNGTWLSSSRSDWRVLKRRCLVFLAGLCSTGTRLSAVLELTYGSQQKCGFSFLALALGGNRLHLYWKPL